MENDKITQEENTNTIKNMVAVFTDGPSLGIPGPTGAGVAVYMACLKGNPRNLQQWQPG